MIDYFDEIDWGNEQPAGSILDSLQIEFAAQESLTDYMKYLGLSGRDDSSLKLVKKLSENEDYNGRLVTPKIDDSDLIISS